jgi:hypothetical protein
MRRVDGWEIKLHEYITRNREASVQWGEMDCCMFACDCIKEITGIDTAEWFRGKYKSKQKAYSLLKEFGGGDLLATVEILTKQFELKEWARPSFAQRGDLVYSEIETCLGGVRGTLGIVGFNGSICIPGKSKLEMIPIERAKTAWKI